MGRSLETRKKEHIGNVRYFAQNSNIANHAWTLSHNIDFDNGQIIDNGNHRIRKTLEFWHTATIDGADNISKATGTTIFSLVKKTLTQ